MNAIPVYVKRRIEDSAEDVVQVIEMNKSCTVLCNFMNIYSFVRFNFEGYLK